MNKDEIVKALGLVSLGLIFWSALVYSVIAFVKSETNPFAWSETTRAVMVFFIFIFMSFSLLATIFSPK